LVNLFFFQKYYFFSYDAKLQTSHSNILRTAGVRSCKLRTAGAAFET